ncbi:MAG: membrane dipeptidase [Planctomycetes bacterium]|nr:membrane dipeptidase [Planctomycetota bacterium]
MSVQLVKQIGRIGREVILELPPDQEELAMDIHNHAVVFDLHLHGVVLPEHEEDYDAWLEAHRFPFAYEGLKHAGVNAFIDGFASMAHTWRLEDAVKEIGLRWCDMDRQPGVISAKKAEDVIRAKREAKIAVFMTIESSEQIGNDLDNIDLLYGLGVRSMGLTYNKRNLVCDGRTERTDCGLSDFGISVIERMNELGMIVDATHAGVKATIEAAQFSKAPIIVSHTGAFGVFKTKRMATDEELKAVASTGGLIGIHSGVNVLSDAKVQTVEVMVDHIDYCVNLIGIDHVCIGSDNYFGDKNAMHEHSIKKHAADGLQKYLSFNAPYMKGIENPSEWKNITRVLITRGYKRESIEKLIGGNALRLVKEMLG